MLSLGGPRNSFLIVLAIFLVLPRISKANLIQVTQVNLTCNASFFCKEFQKRYQTIKGNYRNIRHLEDSLEIYLSRGGVKNVSYRIFKDGDQYRVDIVLVPKKRVSRIDIKTSQSYSTDSLKTAINISVGDFYEPDKISEVEAALKSNLSNKGYIHNKITTVVSENKPGNISLTFKCELGLPVKLRKLNVDSKSKTIKKLILNKFASYLRMPFDSRFVKEKISEVLEELRGYGYYLIQIEGKTSRIGNVVQMDITVKNETQKVFVFNDSELIFDRRELLQPIKDYYKRFERELTPQALNSIIKSLYESKGYLDIDINLKISEYEDKDNEPVQRHTVTIIENKRTEAVEIRFKGNINKSSQEVLKIFESEPDELTRLGIFDSAYYEKFKNKLKKKYLEEGFVEAEITGPFISKDRISNNFKTYVEFQINEGVRARLNEINITGLSKDMKSEALAQMQNKEDSSFNPLVLDQDLKKMIIHFQEKGYYYARIENLESNDLVKYSTDKSSVVVSIAFNLGSEMRLGDILIIGNSKTASEYIHNKIKLEKNDILTPNKVKAIQSRLSTTGLFTYINVKPVSTGGEFTKTTDLLISLEERDSKVFELSPGIRSDLGVKLSSTLKFYNIKGYNRSVQVKAQVNQRLSFSSLAPERRNQEDFTEYNTQVTWDVPEVFATENNFSLTTAVTRTRFFNFDAEILSGSISVNRDWTDYFTTNVRFQYEDIKQFNAITAGDNGEFRIGSVAPSFVLDFRDNRINPLSGAYFNLGFEFANPSLGSQENTTQTIDFYKIISRNSFYIPLDNGVIAIYASIGMQKNNSDNAGIPSIKLFRLNRNRYY
jgi:outer membrane protein assembly factor BamA